MFTTTFFSVLLWLCLVTLASSASAKQVLLDGVTLTLPDGFQINTFANNVPNARQMVLGNNGTVFVGSRRAGEVWALRDNNNDGEVDQRYLIDKNLNMPSGLAFRDGHLYVGAVNQILRYRDIESYLKNPPKPQIAFDNLPSALHHGWKFLRFSPEGALFVPVGAPCNVCEEQDPRFASILKVDIEPNQYTKNYEIFAYGVRNSVGFDWHPQTGEFWFSDNGRDHLGDDAPPCEINLATRAGMHFGFPYVHGGAIADPDFFNGHQFSDFRTPALSLGAHVAPLGIHFYRGKQFPKEFQHQLFVAEHGSWNRSKKVGYKIMLATINNNQATSYTPVVSGFLKGEKTLGRPVAMLELNDGSLLISDDYANKIYRLTYNGNQKP